MKLDSVKFGLTLGIIWAGAVFALALMSTYLSWGTGLMKGLGSLYLGYKPTLIGALTGMIWAFFDAGIGGWLVAVIYNWMLDMGKK
ncbi:MAG: bacteriophage holin [Candidatus Margulisiibacteriota bacterium]